MKYIYFIFIALFLAACASEPADNNDIKEEKELSEQKIKIANDLGFAIQQQKDYVNPDFDVNQKRLAQNPGPHNGKTFIDDADIKTLDDLNKFYRLPNGFKFAIANYKKADVKQPIIVDPDGKLYSFIIENNFLMYDKKIIEDKEGKKYIDWETTEIKKMK